MKNTIKGRQTTNDRIVNRKLDKSTKYLEKRNKVNNPNFDPAQ